MYQLSRADSAELWIDAAVQTGQIRALLAKAGTLVGPYDSMIAAHARALGLILVTNNPREFERIKGLRLEARSVS